MNSSSRLWQSAVAATAAATATASSGQESPAPAAATAATANWAHGYHDHNYNGDNYGDDDSELMDLDDHTHHQSVPQAAAVEPALVVVDTNMLIDALPHIERLVGDAAAATAIQVVIPRRVVLELDGLKSSEKVGAQARSAIRFIDANTAGASSSAAALVLQRVWEEVELGTGEPDDEIFGCAVYFASRGRRVLMLSNDRVVAIKARTYGVPCIARWSGSINELVEAMHSYGEVRIPAAYDSMHMEIADGPAPISPFEPSSSGSPSASVLSARQRETGQSRSHAGRRSAESAAAAEVEFLPPPSPTHQIMSADEQRRQVAQHFVGMCGSISRFLSSHTRVVPRSIIRALQSARHRNVAFQAPAWLDNARSREMTARWTTERVLSRTMQYYAATLGATQRQHAISDAKLLYRWLPLGDESAEAQSRHLLAKLAMIDSAEEMLRVMGDVLRAAEVLVRRCDAVESHEEALERIRKMDKWNQMLHKAAEDALLQLP